jgi:hypothetical protein
VRASKQIGALPPTICFERDLALEMAAGRRAGGGEGVAVYELAGAAHGETEARPFAAFGPVPDPYWRIGRDALLAAAPMKESASAR